MSTLPRKILKAQNVVKFKVPCAFNGQASETELYIGMPESKHNPIYFQSKFISEVQGGVIPQAIAESLEKLQQLAITNGVPFLDLCRHALADIDDQQKLNVVEDNAHSGEIVAINTITHDATSTNGNTMDEKEIILSQSKGALSEHQSDLQADPKIEHSINSTAALIELENILIEKQSDNNAEENKA